MLTLAQKLLSHLESNRRSQGVAPQVVGPLGLERADFLKVLGGHFLERNERPVRRHGARCPQSVDGLVLPQVTSQVAKGEDLPAHAVYAEKRRAGAPGLDGHQCGPGVPRRLSDPLSQRLDRGRQQQLGRAHVLREGILQAHGKVGRLDRVAAQVKEVVPDADRPDVQDLFPDSDQAGFHGVAGGDEAQRPRSRRRLERQGVAIHLAVRRQRQPVQNHQPGGQHVIG